MPKTTYIEKNFTAKTMEIITNANDILCEYEEDGFDLTLRQLYYQFVARGLIANKQTEYKRLGGIISDARLAGLIDWSQIKDRTRELKINNHWNDPGEIIDACANQFQIDKWAEQPYHIEVWVEKEALGAVVGQMCDRLDVGHFACKGYVSASEMWAASQRIGRATRQGKEAVIIHLGDHDPSGIDMTRDIQERQDLFLEYDFAKCIRMRRIALNMDQVEEYNPPPNPAKLTDSRVGGYVKEYGKNSWELDALEPRVIQALIKAEVEGYRDEDLWQKAIDKENEYKGIMARVARDWETL